MFENKNAIYTLNRKIRSFRLQLTLPFTARSAFSLSLTIYNELIKKKIPPIISTKHVVNNAYCNARNSISVSLKDDDDVLATDTSLDDDRK